MRAPFHPSLPVRVFARLTVIAVSLALAGGASAGTLSASQTSVTGTVNLSDRGPTDWAHWGRTSVSMTTMASGNSAISDYQPLGGANPSRTTATKARYSWSNGDPLETSEPFTSGLRVFNPGPVSNSQSPRAPRRIDWSCTLAPAKRTACCNCLWETAAHRPSCWR